MSIFDSLSSRLKSFDEKLLAEKIEKLIAETSQVDANIRKESAALGVEIGNTKMLNYYDILGIKYTDNQKTIRDAYISMIKKYHPDVSKASDAKEHSEKINEAYAVMKDRKLKQQYDTRFSKGTNKIGESATRKIAKSIIEKYVAATNADFNEFNQRISGIQSRDSAKSAIEDVADWNGRYKKVTNKMFGKLWDYGRKVKKLRDENKKMLRKEAQIKRAAELSENMDKLETLFNSYESIEQGISAIIKSTREQLAAQEQKQSEKLRAIVQ